MRNVRRIVFQNRCPKFPRPTSGRACRHTRMRNGTSQSPLCPPLARTRCRARPPGVTLRTGLPEALRLGSPFRAHRSAGVSLVLWGSVSLRCTQSRQLGTWREMLFRSTRARRPALEPPGSRGRRMARRRGSIRPDRACRIIRQQRRGQRGSTVSRVGSCRQFDR